MTMKIYQTPNYNTDHSAYGGEITLFDFEGHHTLSSMAEKIASDRKFDEKCRKRQLNRNYSTCRFIF